MVGQLELFGLQGGAAPRWTWGVCVHSLHWTVAIPLHVPSGAAGEAFQSLPRVGPSAVALPSETTTSSLNWVSDLLSTGICSGATELCRKVFSFILVVLFSHTFSHVDSSVFPACLTFAFSVPLQEQEQKLNTCLIASLTNCLKFLDNWCLIDWFFSSAKAKLG